MSLELRKYKKTVMNYLKEQVLQRFLLKRFLLLIIEVADIDELEMKIHKVSTNSLIFLVLVFIIFN